MGSSEAVETAEKQSRRKGATANPADLGSGASFVKRNLR
jgi:hypothetical protein